MKKIMFSDRYGLTDAVLSGRKTMTRRIVPPIEVDWNGRGLMTLPVSGFKHGLLWMDCSEFLPGSGPFDYVAPQKYQPRYGKGDLVAVAQAYQTLRWPALPGIDWKAITDEVTRSKGWTNKMFVKAEYMPHRIRITDRWFERLQDISDEDCLKEGVFEDAEEHGGLYTTPFYDFVGNDGDGFTTPRAAFAALIDRICGRGTWKSNPWDVAYEFELIRKEG